MYTIETDPNNPMMHLDPSWQCLRCHVAVSQLQAMMDKISAAYCTVQPPSSHVFPGGPISDGQASAWFVEDAALQADRKRNYLEREETQRRCERAIKLKRVADATRMQARLLRRERLARLEEARARRLYGLLLRRQKAEAKKVWAAKEATWQRKLENAILTPTQRDAIYQAQRDSWIDHQPLPNVINAIRTVAVPNVILVGRRRAYKNAPAQ